MFFSIKFRTNFNRFQAFLTTIFVAISQGLNAAAIFLLIKFFLLTDFNHSLRTAFFPPVIVPKNQVRIMTCGTLSAIIHLLQVFPARNAQRSGKNSKTVFVCI